MGEIQGQVVAADINDDGKVEILSADVRGNVAAWTGDGKELWTVHLKSIVAQVIPCHHHEQLVHFLFSDSSLFLFLFLF